MTFTIGFVPGKDPASEPSFTLFAVMANSGFTCQPESGRVDLGKREREFIKQTHWSLYVKVLMRDPCKNRW